MRFGHFDDQNKEYVITTPQTPLPWINYLGSEDFFSLVSNTAGGYSFYRDARLRRLTRYRYNSSPLDMDGHHIYIKDGDTVWNPGWQPTKTELDSYTCRHGLGYTILEGRKNGVTAQQELFVPKGDACELDRLILRNDSGTEKSWMCSAMWSSACGTLWTTAPTSSAISPPVKSRWRAALSIIRPNTVSAVTTTLFSGPTAPSAALTPPVMHSAAYMAARQTRRPFGQAIAPAASPMAGLLLVRCTSM